MGLWYKLRITTRLGNYDGYQIVTLLVQRSSLLWKNMISTTGLKRGSSVTARHAEPSVRKQTRRYFAAEYYGVSPSRPGSILRFLPQYAGSIFWRWSGMKDSRRYLGPTTKILWALCFRLLLYLALS